MTGTLILLASLVLCSCGLVAYRARWIGTELRLTAALVLADREKASRKSVEHQLNIWILRAGAAESKLEELWMQDCEDRAREREVVTGSVHLTDEEARRVMLILFPERQRASGGKPS